MSTVLVTGAAGFIGRAVVKALLRRPGVHVVAAVRSENEQWDDIGDKNRFASIGGIDLTMPETLRKIPERLTHVAHTAALVRFEGATEEELVRANVDATQHVIDRVLAGSRATLERILYTSTFGVHDRPAFRRITGPLQEDAPLTPTSVYGETKLEGERRIAQCGLPHVTARLSWIYGPTMRKNSHLRSIGRMCRQNHPLTRIGFPGRVSAAYIEDVGEALAGLLFKPALAHSVYFVAHAVPVSFEKIFSSYRRALGRPDRALVPSAFVRPVRWASPVLPMKLRSLVDDYYVCRTDRLAAEGLTLPTPFEEGIKKSVTGEAWFEE